MHGGGGRSTKAAGAASAVAMSVKRALQLDTVKKDDPAGATPLKTKKKNLDSYSPTTGTRQISPFSSPLSHNAQNLRNHPSNGNGPEQNASESRLPRRGQPRTEEDAFVELQSKVKSSLVRIQKIRANLTSLQALEGSKELENIIGVSDLSCVLSAELQKTQVLSKEEFHESSRTTAAVEKKPWKTSCPSPDINHAHDTAVQVKKQQEHIIEDHRLAVSTFRLPAALRSSGHSSTEEWQFICHTPNDSKKICALWTMPPSVLQHS